MTDNKWTPGPWHVCQRLKGVAEDKACGCGYRGVIYGPEHDAEMAICQPGHEPAPAGQEGSEPSRYPREVEIANARLIASAPDLYDALVSALHCIEAFGIQNGGIPSFKAALAKAEGRSL